MKFYFLAFCSFFVFSSCAEKSIQPTQPEPQTKTSETQKPLPTTTDPENIKREVITLDNGTQLSFTRKILNSTSAPSTVKYSDENANDNSQKLSNEYFFYFKTPQDQQWQLIDKANLEETDVALKPKGILEISTHEGGSLSTDSIYKFRFEPNNTFKLIGHESESYNRPAAYDNNSDSPYQSNQSDNFLSGKSIAVENYTNTKLNKKYNCNFDKTKYENFKISYIPTKSNELPECPNDETFMPLTTKLNGEWILKDIKCKDSKLNPLGFMQSKKFNKSENVQNFKIENGKVTKEHLYYNAQKELSCKVIQKETWRFDNKKIFIKNTNYEYIKFDFENKNCSGQTTENNREYLLSYKDSNLVITIPSYIFMNQPICEDKYADVIYTYQRK